MLIFSLRFSRNKNELPVYASDDESEPDVCVLCLDPSTDLVQFGQLVSIGAYKVHYLCCVSCHW